ncbi:MAG: PAS domain-containing sensor histidine kinase [Rhodospirillales bacterium]|nr:PAS domain-containing sensor histidine kinase [Rhodospirillales bacterium]
MIRPTRMIPFIPGLAAKMGNSRGLSYALAAAAVISGIATVASLTTPDSDTFNVLTVVTLLYIDGIILLLLSVVVGRRLFLLWRERRNKAAGSGLQGRLVTLFSFVAVTPAILVAVFSALFLNHGLEVWFSDRVNTALNQSLIVAKSYLDEHQKTISSDILAIANDLNFNAARLFSNPLTFNQILTTQSLDRSLSEVIAIDGAGNVLARSNYSTTEKLESLPPSAFVSADSGKIAVLDSSDSKRVRALIKLERFIGTYLVVERFIDNRVSDHITSIHKAVSEYNEMKKKRGGFQVTFVVIFAVVALLLLLAAAWIGLTVAKQLATPISRLIGAAEDVSKGDLSVRVSVAEEDDEIRSLGQAFNKMTSQLETQRDGLVQANRELDERRRFTATVLTGVSAGVIGLDAQGLIHLPNRSASSLLAVDLDAAVGRPLGEVIPEMRELLHAVMEQGGRMRQDEIELIRDNTPLTLHVRIATEFLDQETIGYVVTFDDVTELLSAQRKAAWADVARRIAHEIKNPLTPIQLSAERLERKYLKEISTEPEVFKACIGTIIRQVEDIGRMVDEFSAFARMPEPSMQTENISEICRQAVFLEENRYPEINFTTRFPDKDVSINCDGRQISRALTNLLKNASESVISKIEESGDDPGTGEIVISLEQAAAVTDDNPQGSGFVTIKIVDNGKGLPVENRDRLTEPYMTTRSKGTGLGLAIVKKIIEDHGGNLKLADNPQGGAEISFTLAVLSSQELGNSLAKPEKSPLQAEIQLAMRSAGE